MNLEDVTVSIEPREVSGCLDLAVQFYRMHFGQLVALASLVAVPAVVLTWLLADLTRSGLLVGLTIYFFASPVAGALVVA